MRNLQRFAESDDHFEALQLYMKTPVHLRGKLMPQELADKLEHLQLANTWLGKYGSHRQVWPMMQAHFEKLGVPYSESTARREVRQAMEFFGTASRHTCRYYTEWMLEGLIERANSAARAHKDREYAMLSMAVDRFIERMERYAKEDEELITNPIPVMAVFDLKEAGITPDPNILEKIKEWKLQRGKPTGDGIQDADFTEEPPPDAP